MSPVSSKDSKVTITVYCSTLLQWLQKRIYDYIIIAIFIFYVQIILSQPQQEYPWCSVFIVCSGEVQLFADLK